MADTVIKFDADTSSYLGKIKQMGDAHEKVLGGLGKEVDLGDKFAHGLERSLAHSIGLAEVVKRIADAMTTIAKQTADFNKSIGGRQNDLASSLVSFGFKGDQIDTEMATVNQPGGRATLEERSGLAGGLASINVSRAKKGWPLITPAQFNQAQELGRRGGSLIWDKNLTGISGMFDDPNLNYGLNQDVNVMGQEFVRKRAGLPVGTVDPIGVMLNSMPSGLKGEGISRDYEFRNKIREEESANSDMGRKLREVVSDQELFAVEHPVGAAGMAATGAIGAATDIANRLNDKMNPGFWSRMLNGFFSGGNSGQALDIMQRQILRHDAHEELK
jgi:hypothetical protein